MKNCSSSRSNHEFVTGDLDEARKTYELRSQIYAHDDIPIGNAGNVYFFSDNMTKPLKRHKRHCDVIRAAVSEWKLVSSYLALQRFAGRPRRGRVGARPPTGQSMAPYLPLSDLHMSSQTLRKWRGKPLN